MAEAPVLVGGLSEPVPLAALLVARLLEFNQWPSRMLHPARAQAVWTEQELAQQGRSASLDRVLHLRASRRLLAQLGSDAMPVTQLNAPALPLALMASDLQLLLVRRVGLMALGKLLSSLIARAQVVQAREDLGRESMDWAIAHAWQWPESGWLHPVLQLQQGWTAKADLLGSAVLARSWQQAPAPLRRRADWSLAPQACELVLPETITEVQARTLCLSQLAEMEPAWLLLFPPQSTH